MKSEDIIELIRYFTNEVDELKKNKNFLRKKKMYSSIFLQLDYLT